MKRRILIICFLLLSIVVVILAFNYKRIIKLNSVNHLFDAENIVDNFQRIEKIFDVSVVPPSTNPRPIPTKLRHTLLDTFSYLSQSIGTEDFLKSTRTEGLLIIQHDTVVYESYDLGLTPSESHISWSLSKSFTSTIMGILVDQGKIDIQKKIIDYLPQFQGTGYENATVKHLLQMSSGVKFNEDYGDFYSDINRFGRAFALGTPLEDFATSLTSERTPGTYNHYVSIDTQVLGLLIMQVTGKSMTELLSAMLWEPLGMEYQAEWIVDNTGKEVVLGGLNATLRDYAKLGLLMLHDGEYQGKQIVSKEWVSAATTPDAPHLQPNQTALSSNILGYGYQWWLPQFPENDFFGAGIYDQFIYVNRDKHLVIVKLSADHNYKTDRKGLISQHLAMFQSMARAM